MLTLIYRSSGDRLVHVAHFYEQIKQWSQLSRNRWPEAHLAIAEAWAWLKNNGLIVPSPSQPGSSSYFELTRKASRILIEGGFDNYRKSILFTKELLHRIILEKAWPNFIRGDYDTAIFQSFKEVEIAVRTGAHLSPKLIGTSLMREAFDKNTGPLTDMSVPESEREALAHLFAGAIGSYKNPHSHRRVGVLDTKDAGELMFLASHLLRIVEDRAGRPVTP